MRLMILRACGVWVCRAGLIVAACLVSPAQAAAAPFVWLEGEKPARINHQPKPEGVGNPQFLSQSNWLKISLEADKLVEIKSLDMLPGANPRGTPALLAVTAASAE